MIDIEREIREAFRRHEADVPLLDPSGAPDVASRSRRRQVLNTVVVGVAAILIVIAGSSATDLLRAEHRRPLGTTPTPVPSEEPGGGPAEHNDASFVDLRTGRATLLPAPLRAIASGRNYSASPDRSMIAFEAIGPRDTGYQIYVGNVDGTNVHRLTDEPRSATDPTWSPAGDRIAYVSGLGMGQGISIVDVSSGRSTALLSDVGNIWQPSFSADGQTILFTYAERAHRDKLKPGMWIVPAGGGEMTRLIRNAAYGAYSPDGSEIAVHRAAAIANAYCGMCFWTNSHLLIVAGHQADLGPSLGGMLAPPFAIDWHVRWSPDGSKIVFSSPGNPGPLRLRDVVEGTTVTLHRGRYPSWFDDDTLIIQEYQGRKAA